MWIGALISLLSAGVPAPPAAAQPTNDAPPSISGTMLQGQPLTEVPGSWSEVSGVSLQWEACPNSLGSGCTPILNSPTSPGSQYVPTTSEIGQWITVVETASDGRGNFGSVIAVPVGPVTLDLVTATMQWTFYYTPSYTKVMALNVSGLSPQTSVQLGCRGRGCPFSKRIAPPNAGRTCRHGRQPNCLPPGSLDLSHAFNGYRLHVGTQITVAITIPGGVGKFYAFMVRASRGPRVSIGCLAPGATYPGGSC